MKWYVGDVVFNLINYKYSTVVSHIRVRTYFGPAGRPGVLDVAVSLHCMAWLPPYIHCIASLLSPHARLAARPEEAGEVNSTAARPGGTAILASSSAHACGSVESESSSSSSSSYHIISYRHTYNTDEMRGHRSGLRTHEGTAN